MIPPRVDDPPDPRDPPATPADPNDTCPAHRFGSHRFNAIDADGVIRCAFCGLAFTDWKDPR